MGTYIFIEMPMMQRKVLLSIKNKRSNLKDQNRSPNSIPTTNAIFPDTFVKVLMKLKTLVRIYSIIVIVTKQEIEATGIEIIKDRQ